MLKYWKDYIVNLGVSFIPEEVIARKVKVFNWVLLLVVFVDALLMVLWFVFGGISEAIAVMLHFLASVSVFFLMKKGFHLLGRNMVFYVSIVSVCSVSYFSGREAMAHLQLIYFGLSAFLFFDFETEKKSIYTIVSIIVLCIVLLEVVFFDDVAFSENPSVYYLYLIHLGLSGLVFRIILYFVTETKKYEDKLEEKNKVLMRSEAELLMAKEKAEQALLIKSQFLSNMSHEMRTPLNSILGFSDLVLDRVSDGETKEYLEYISRASKNMSDLVKDILDYSKFESDQFQLRPSFFSLPKIIDEVYYLLKLTGDKKGLKFKKHTNIDESCFIKTDEVRLKQILINLLSNAIKFTSDGTVGLDVSLLDKNAGDTVLNIKVSDTGIGIEEKNQVKIFENFTQVEDDDNREYDGTGLGLSIVKQLVNLMAGDIEVSSELGKGTTFSLSIPVQVSYDEKLNVQESTTSTNLLKNNLSILVVDDNEMNLLLIEKMFSQEGFSLDLVDSGEEALTRLSETKYDYLLIDFQMPELTGLDVFERFTNDQSTYVLNKEIKTIMITADIFEDTKQKIINAGIRHILTKPIKREDLFALINKRDKG